MDEAGVRRRRPWSKRSARAFLAALTESCNVTEAAEAVGVTRSAAYKQRQADAAFAAAWDAALAEGAERLEAVEAPPSGHEVICRNKNRQVQIASARARMWTVQRQEMFLEHLAATCNVTASVRAAGLSSRDIYRHRKKWPAFREAWDEALAMGYARLEAALVEKAINALCAPQAPEVPGEEVPPGGGGGFDPQLALNLLKTHRAAVKGEAPRRRGAAVARRPSIEEVRANILRKLDAIERHEARKGSGRAE